MYIGQFVNCLLSPQVKHVETCLLIGGLKNVNIYGAFYVGQVSSPQKKILQYPTGGCRMGLNIAASILGAKRGVYLIHLSECQLLLNPYFQCGFSPSPFTAYALGSGTQLLVPLWGVRLVFSFYCTWLI